MENRILRSRKARIAIMTTLVILAGWTVLTAWVETPGKSDTLEFGDATDSTRVLITYDPDPIYDLDKQICVAIGEGLATNHASVLVATTAATKNIDLGSFDLFVVCANTYNWGPDMAVVDFISSNEKLRGKCVVAITIGSGSTEAASKKLEKYIVNSGARILASKQWWLMRPNDETRLEEDNVKVATDQAYRFGESLGQSFRLCAF